MWTAASSRLTQISWLALLATVVGAVVLRLVGLDHLPGLNGDEAVYPVHASQWLAGVPLSELRTGTDLPMNPVFFGVVTLLAYLLPASAWSLRLAALIQSLLAIALAFVLFRKQRQLFAALFATLLAVLPIQLGYARLAWDSTAVPAVVVLALAAATRAHLFATVLAFGLCLWVHPSTVFVGPILMAPLIAARWPRHADGSLRRPSRKALVLTLVALGATCALVFWLLARNALPTPVLAALRGGLPARIWERASSPSQALQFLLLYAELLTGPTIYRYVAGSMPLGAAWTHVAIAVAWLALVVFAFRRLPATTRTTDLAVGIGLGVSLVGAYLVGGLPVLAPHSERYGMFLVAPTCYVLAACGEALADGQRRAALVRLATAGLGAFLLASFATYFLSALHHADSARHNTFRTGPIEPKQQALAEILAARARDRVTVVHTEDWWIYWPLRYLAGARHDLRVTIADARWDFRFPRDFVIPQLDPETMELFGVAWAGSRRDTEYARAGRDRVEIRGYESTALLHVYRLPIPSVQPRK